MGEDLGGGGHGMFPLTPHPPPPGERGLIGLFSEQDGR